jgi:hypothetical protein
MLEVEVKKNFEWDCTENKLTIFVPCYKNIDTVRFTIEHISTILEPWDYTIIIGNDGFHHHWGDLSEALIHRDHPVPVKYFSLLHTEQQPRNSCFIRNYAMKRCMSEYFMQKDCSVVLEGDFPLYAIRTCEAGYFWRAGNITVVSKEDTYKCVENNDLLDLGTSLYHRVEPVKATSVEELKNHLIIRHGQVNFSTYFQYAFCAPTQFLKGIHGYDEDYRWYGYEDTDMFCRLTALGKIIKPDYDTYAHHLWHPSTVNEEQLIPMRELFRSKNPEQTLRNPEGWVRGK